MFKRFSLQLDKDRYDYIESYRVRNKLDDNSEALRLIISDRIEFENSGFFKRLFFKK